MLKFQLYNSNFYCCCSNFGYAHSDYSGTDCRRGSSHIVYLCLYYDLGYPFQSLFQPRGKISLEIPSPHGLCWGEEEFCLEAAKLGCYWSDSFGMGCVCLVDNSITLMSLCLSGEIGKLLTFSLPFF